MPDATRAARRQPTGSRDAERAFHDVGRDRTQRTAPAAGVPTQQGERVVDRDAVRVRDHALGLFDDDATVECFLQLLPRALGLFELRRVDQIANRHVGEDRGGPEIVVRPVARRRVVEVEAAETAILRPQRDAGRRSERRREEHRAQVGPPGLPGRSADLTMAPVTTASTHGPCCRRSWVCSASVSSAEDAVTNRSWFDSSSSDTPAPETSSTSVM